MDEYLIISTSVDLVRSLSEEVVFIQADGNYSSLHFTHNRQNTVTLQLGQIERNIALQLPQTGTNFIRIGKSLIINRKYVSYINLARQMLILNANDGQAHSLSASREALKQLKELIEREQK